MDKKFVLVDVNTLYYNCGHYPEYEIQEREGSINEKNQTRRGTMLEYSNIEEAKTVCDSLNAATQKRWREYLNM